MSECPNCEVARQQLLSEQKDWVHHRCRCGHERDVHVPACDPVDPCDCKAFDLPLRVELYDQIDAARQQLDALIAALYLLTQKWNDDASLHSIRVKATAIRGCADELTELLARYGWKE